MKIISALRFAPVLLLVLASCSSDAEKQKELPKQQDLTKILNGRDAGVVGVFDMPEMLTISIMDSSSAKDISFHMAKDYTVLEEEAREILTAGLSQGSSQQPNLFEALRKVVEPVGGIE